MEVKLKVMSTFLAGRMLPILLFTSLFLADHNICIQRGLAPQGAPLGGPKLRQILNIDILGDFRLPK